MKNILLLSGIVVAFFIVRCSNIKESGHNGLLEINGTELYVESIGQGEPIIIIHGGPVLDHGYIQPYLKNLEEDYQLIYYDQRLSGRSSSQVDTSQVTINKFIMDIDAIREYFGYQRVHILGHSWGGLLAMEYALRYEKNVKSLLLINPMPPSYSLWQKEQEAMASRVSRRDSIERKKIMDSVLFKENPPKAINMLLRLSFKSQLADSSLVDSLQFFIPEDYMMRSQKFSNLGTYLFNYDIVESLKKLNLPTLIVIGENEPSVEITTPVLESSIKNSKVVIFKNSGHFPFLENPRKFTSEVKRFLNSNKHL